MGSFRSGVVMNETEAASEDGIVRILGDFKIPSSPGMERLAMDLVETAVESLDLPEAQLERLKTAVSEATMNAIEHGNRYQAGLDVAICVTLQKNMLVVAITDQGEKSPPPASEAPDLEAKLAGLQKPRGWGHFLIQNMVDEMRVREDEDTHTVELVLKIRGGKHGERSV